MSDTETLPVISLIREVARHQNHIHVDCIKKMIIKYEANMRKSELYVGQRVYVPLERALDGNESTSGKEGTVVAVYNAPMTFDLAVDFDEAITGGYNCGGKARNGHGYKGYARNVEEILEDINLPSKIEVSFSELMATAEEDAAK